MARFSLEMTLSKKHKQIDEQIAEDAREILDFSDAPAEADETEAVVIEITADAAYSSVGQYLRGDKAMVPAADAKLLISEGKAVRA